MVYYSKYYALLWFTTVYTIFTMVYYGEYHNLLWFIIVNSMLYYGELQ